MKKELLAPCGSFETLKQAIHNGCDAVYLAGKNYGARKFANNFSEEEMVKAIKYCHLYGVRIYVTVNTLIYDNEVDEFINYIRFLHENGVDAVIMQDLGMISLVRKIFPNLDIHVSTQAHTHNIKQIKHLEKLGVTRLVIARETSLDDIKKLDTKLEIETFIHGALCVCYSGQCLFSSMLLNRSGNRGECAGICRLPFKLFENDKEIKTEGKYLLSPKELNTTNHIKELMESNITSFKIEGRMKNPTTIGFIVRMYRSLIDHYEKGEEVKLTLEEEKNLLTLFNREYTDGYLFNKSGKSLMNIKSPNHIGVEIGKVIDISKDKIKIKLSDDLNQEDGIRFMESDLGLIANFIYDKNDKLISGAKSGDIIYLDNKINLKTLDTINKTTSSKLIKELENYIEKKIPITIKASVKNTTFTLELSDGINKLKLSDDIVEEAKNSGTSISRIEEQLLKLGNTPFICNSIDINIKDNIFVPISKINELRRKIVEELINIRENNKKEVIINDIESLSKYDDDKKELNVLVRNESQLKACLDNNIDKIYITDSILYDKYKENKNVYLRLSHVNNKYKDYENSNLLIGEIGSINKYSSNNKLSGDYYLNVTNSYTVDYFRKNNLDNITLSTECNIENIKDIVSNIGNKNIEVIIYGRLEAMIMKYCPLKMLINNDNKVCSICRNGNKYYLKDRNNEIYPLLQDNTNHLTHILYYKNYDKDNELNELKEIINKYRLELFDEDYLKTVNLIKKYKTLLNI